jgi:hypothetical protein
VLADWEAQYGLGLSIFLPDTFGSDWFFSKVVSPEQLARWKGSRQDSGVPLEYAEKRIREYVDAGFKHSEETKAKLSQLKIGSVVSQETKIKISLANKGRKLPHRRNLNNWPCPEMSKCQCERCKNFKRSLSLARYYNKKGQAA